MQHKAHHFPRFPSPSCFSRPNQAKTRNRRRHRLLLFQQLTQSLLPILVQSFLLLHQSLCLDQLFFGPANGPDAHPPRVSRISPGKILWLQFCLGWVVPEPGTELSSMLPSKWGTFRRPLPQSSKQIRASQPSRAPLLEPRRETLIPVALPLDTGLDELTFPGFGFWRSCFLGACEGFETADGELRFSHFADGRRGPLRIILHTACWRSSSQHKLAVAPHQNSC